MGGQMNEFGVYLQAIRSRFWLVILMVVIAVGAAYSTVGTRRARYTSDAIMMVTAPVLTPPPSITGEGSFRPSQVTVTADILQLINSRPIAARVAKRLDLSGPQVVQRAVTAFPERGTSLIRISATSGDPERAAALANITAEEFIAYFRETNRNAVGETRRFVEEQLALSRARLEQSERAIQTFRENRRILSAGEAGARIMSAANSAESELDVATRAREEVDARLIAIRERLARERPLVVGSRLTTENPIFRQIQSHLLGLEIRRVQLAQVYTPQHPRMEAINHEIADVRNRLMAEARTTIGEEVTINNPTYSGLVGQVLTLEVERAAVGARLQALQYTLRRRQQEVQSVASIETEYNRLARENRMLEANFTTLANRYQDLLLRENEAGFFPASIQLIEAAVPPVTAAPSSFPRTGATAGAIGFMFGILGVLLLESLDDRIRSAQDAERVLGVPVLAQIPSHGGQPRIAPAPAVYLIIVLLVAGVAWAAIARGYLSLPGRVSEQVRGVTAMMTSMAGSTRGSTVGVAEENR